MTEKERINVCWSEIDEMIDSLENNSLEKKDIYSYFYKFLKASGVNSDFTVKVLNKFLDKDASDIVLGIKINEGW